jgi:hypothetical protein
MHRDSQPYDRELILNAEAGKTLKSNADKTAVHLGRKYIRQVFSAIRKGIEKAVLAELNGPAERLGLHAKLSKLLEQGVSMIRKDDGKERRTDRRTNGSMERLQRAHEYRV